MKSDFHFLYLAAKDVCIPFPLVLAVMSAPIFLYAFASIDQRICVCKIVSQRETLAAVCDWAC